MCTCPLLSETSSSGCNTHTCSTCRQVYKKKKTQTYEQYEQYQRSVVSAVISLGTITQQSILLGSQEEHCSDYTGIGLVFW